MSVKNTFPYLYTFHYKNENTLNLLLNHLAVIYIFFVPFTPHSHTVSFLFILMYVLVIGRGNYLKYIKISLSNPIVLPFLIMMSIHYAWLFGTQDVEFAKTTLKYSHYFFYPFFFFLFMDQRFYNRLLTSLLAGVILSESLSYLMQFNIIPHGYSVLWQVPWKESGKLIQFYGYINNEPAPFLEHSWYSVLLSAASSIFFYKGLTSKNIKYKILNFLFFISISINLLFIGGRTGYILYLLLVLIVIAFVIKKNIALKNIVIGLILPFLIISFMYQTNRVFQQRVHKTIQGYESLKTSENRLQSSDGSFNQRFECARASIILISKNFLFGVGTGDQHSELISDPKNIDNPIQHLRDVHNQYLDIFMQFGVIGISFYIYLFYKIAKFRLVDQEKKVLKTIALVAMIFVGFFASFWYFLPVLFTMLIIISSANKNIISTPVEQPTGKVILGYISMILLSYTIGILQ